MQDFIHASEYAAYVWPAYIVTAVGIGGLVHAIWKRGNDLTRRLRDLEGLGRRAPPENWRAARLR